MGFSETFTQNRKYSCLGSGFESWHCELLCVTVQFLADLKGLCGNSFVCSVVLLQGAGKCKMWGLLCVEGLVYRTQNLYSACLSLTS